MEFRITFKKTVYGFADVEADSAEQAKEKLNSGDVIEEFDNKVDYKISTVLSTRELVNALKSKELKKW